MLGLGYYGSLSPLRRDPGARRAARDSSKPAATLLMDRSRRQDCRPQGSGLVPMQLRGCSKHSGMPCR
eukprot:12906429-Prorocentrum_lima.AAC.1